MKRTYRGTISKIKIEEKIDILGKY